jgi:hypothetical protein
MKHKVFISYHHAADSGYKNQLLTINERLQMFIDCSVDTGAISDECPDQRIREIIRDEYLRDSTVTIVLVGLQTRGRKHIDWEIYSSMFDGAVNKRSGVLAILLPDVPNRSSKLYIAHGGEEALYPDVANWVHIKSLEVARARSPELPDRILDNLIVPYESVSVTEWARVQADPGLLATLIEMTHRDRAKCKYDLSRPMRRANSEGLRPL